MPDPKILLGFILILIIQLPQAEYLSLGSSYSTNYQSNFLSYYQNLTNEYSGNIRYSHDAVSNNFFSLGMSLDKNIDKYSHYSFHFETEKQKEYQDINTFGISYSTYLISDKEYRQEVEEQLIDMEQELLFLERLVFADYQDVTFDTQINSEKEAKLEITPRIYAGIFFSGIYYVSENFQDTGQNISLGAGLNINDLLDLSLSYDQYSYASEKTIKSKGVGELAVNPLLYELNTMPRSNTSVYLSFYPFEIIRLFFEAELTVDLLDQKALSNKLGAQLFVSDSFDILMSSEKTGERSIYNTIYCGYLF